MPKPKDHAGKDFSQRLTNTTKIGGVPREYRPPRDVQVPVVSVVACPTCMAPIGERCIGVTSGKTMTAHPVRRRLAVRIRNQQLGESA
jgi:hypothetical protein